MQFWCPWSVTLAFLMPVAAEVVTFDEAPTETSTMLKRRRASECCCVAINDTCWEQVIWAMENGIKDNPGWYPSLNESSSFIDFQIELYNRQQCYHPCIPATITSTETTSITETFTTISATETTSTTVTTTCNFITKAGEECYTAIMWAMKNGTQEVPSWYPPGLNANSSFMEFQVFFHEKDPTICPHPCTGENSAAPAWHGSWALLAVAFSSLDIAQHRAMRPH